jgi:hypothetical protein
MKDSDPRPTLGHVVKQSSLHQSWMIMSLGPQRAKQSHSMALVGSWHTIKERPLCRSRQHRFDYDAVLLGHPGANCLEELGGPIGDSS